MSPFAKSTVYRIYKNLCRHEYAWNLSYAVLALFLAMCFLLLAACGQSTSQSGNADNQSTPALTPQKGAYVSPTSQSAPSSPTPTGQVVPASPEPTNPTASALPTSPQSEGVNVQTDKLSYSNKSTLYVTVINATTHPIYLSAYYTNCTPIQLQMKSASWLNVGNCPERTQSIQALQAGDSLIFQLHPTAPGGFQSRSRTTWTPGIYRVLLTYASHPDPDAAHGNLSFASREFMIDA